MFHADEPTTIKCQRCHCTLPVDHFDWDYRGIGAKDKPKRRFSACDKCREKKRKDNTNWRKGKTLKERRAIAVQMILNRVGLTKETIYDVTHPQEKPSKETPESQIRYDLSDEEVLLIRGQCAELLQNIGIRRAAVARHVRQYGGKGEEK